ncbi:MAG: hypothetical protein HKN44_07755 [Ilumatobacter sp.]|nr:hypothetical protein [Ilumatobacter sp.]
MVKTAKSRTDATLIGWREWAALPCWGIEAIKAKIDTGARTSAIHAFDLESFERDGEPWLRFEIHPWQRSSADEVVVEAQRIDRRTVTSSSGTRSDRPVVLAQLDIAGRSIDAELTLTRRDEMGFRMLIGREALRRRFLIDPAQSYLGGRPPREVRRRNRARQ